jgi:ribosomal protein S18 acetylase RimI-like enzyme
VSTAGGRGTPIEGLELRSLGYADVEVLRAMLYEAAFWRPDGERPPLEQALASPDLAHYAAGWGRAGDLGLVADVQAEPVGAAWLRRFAARDPGYGFVDEDTPELGIGVAEAWRGRGVGTALLTGLLERTRADGTHRVSLSVEVDNPSRRLYERAGFEIVEHTEGAVTMVVDLNR